MSYIVLARKWRPETFDELIGQKTISTILKNALSQGRIAHAYVFSGPRGVGKTSTARILAKALNCAGGPTTQPCGRCDFCRSVTEGHAVDVMEIDGASNNSVDDIRDLRERVKYAPSAGRYKIYIIDEVHMLSQSAFNALLKTLEEPPPHVVFILATTAFQKIPVTVLSRCQHLSFVRVPFPDMKAQIMRITAEEGIGISEQAVDLLVRAAEGSMRDALTLLEQLTAFSTEISGDDVRALLGLSDVDMILKTAEALVKGDRKEILSLVGRLYDSGADFRAFVRELLQLIRTLLVSKITASASAEEISEVEREWIEKMLPAVTEEELTLLLTEMMKTDAEVRNAFSPRIAVELGLIRASMLRSLRPVGDIIRRLQGLGAAFPPEAAGQQPPDRGSPDTDPGKASATPDGGDGEAGGGGIPASPETGREGPVDRDDWAEVLAVIGKEDPALASKLECAAAEIRAERLVLGFNGGHSIHAESVQKNIEGIKRILREAGNPALRAVKEIDVVKGAERKAGNGRMLVTPGEKKVMDILGGRIVEKRRTNV